MDIKQGRKGVELETSRLKDHHSTTELQPLPIHPVTQNEGQNNYKFSVFFCPRLYMIKTIITSSS